MTGQDPRRGIPGVDRLLELDWCLGLVEAHGRIWVTERLRTVMEGVRSGRLTVPETPDGYGELVAAEIDRRLRPSLRPVVNATGVVLHTNLGRAPLALEAREAMERASGYGNLEYDLDLGARGSRYDHCVSLLRELTGAEDGVVVNNGAAAVALALTALAGGRGVAVSHGELIEIGGGFRIPAVVEAAGASLVAVGTTNRTRIGDYEKAIESGGVAAILKVHRSNFNVSGFTEETPLHELVDLGRTRGIPVIHDLGSGLMLDPASLGLPPEPTPTDSVAAGGDLVAFSGDKLLGGPQAGILVGVGSAVAQARSHPLCRAVRTDKVTLAGLEATLALYRDPSRAMAKIPTLRMLLQGQDELEARANRVIEGLPAGLEATVEDGVSLVGGGTFPGVELPSKVVQLTTEESPEAWSARLRAADPAVVTRSADGRILLDMRTVLPEQVEDLVRALSRLTRPASPPA